MSDFEKLARNACKGNLDCQEELVLTQPNWIRFMMGLPLLNVSKEDMPAKESVDCEADLEEALDEIEHPKSDKKEVVVPKDKSIIERFLRQWMKSNRDKKVMPTIFFTLEKIGEKQNFVNNDRYSYPYWENYIVNYGLIDCNIKVFLAYKGNTDNSWSSYFLRYISTIIRDAFGGIRNRRPKVKKSTFVFRVSPDEIITIFSKTADVSCIKDTSLELRVDSKVVANLTPKSGLTFKCGKELFKSDKVSETLATLDLSMEIKNFRTASKASSYAYEYEHSQFLSTELFKDCKHLYNVELSDDVRVVEYDCFAGCSKMKTLKVPFKHLIAGEANYPFKIVSRDPITKEKEPNDSDGASNGDTSTNDNNKIDSLDNRFSGNTEMNREDDGELNDVYFEGLDTNALDIIGGNSRAVEESFESDEKLCIRLMSNKLHSAILYYTYYGLPIDVKHDKNDNVKIGDIERYLTSKHPEWGHKNWSAEKLRAINEYRKVYIVYTKWKEWNLSKKDKVEEAKAFLLNDNRIGENELRVFAQLLSGNTFAQIARNNNVKEISLRTKGISRAFSLLYEFMK